MQSEPSWDISEILHCVGNIANTLQALHDGGVVHRDLKPENIKITKDGKIKILDYGLAKIIDYSSITQTGAKIGTYYYMSPEQVKGEKPIREGSDYYGIGVILFELLTGHILFYPSTDAEIVYKTVYVKPPYPSKYNAEIPNYIENLILKLLEKEVTKRYRSIDEIIQMLDSGATVKKPEKKEVKKFYPRLIQNDTAVIEKFLDHYQVDGANFPINLHSQYKKINDLLKSRSTKIDFFADPGTNRLVFSKFRNT